MDNREERREEMREERREEKHLANQNAEDVLANGKRQHNRSTRRINKLWLWLGVIILVFLLFWWLWTICMAEDATGVTNGTVDANGTLQMILPLLGR